MWLFVLVVGMVKRNNELERIHNGIVLYVEQLLSCTTLSLMEVSEEVNIVLYNIQKKKKIASNSK